MSKEGKYSRYHILLTNFHSALKNLDHLNNILPKLYTSYNNSELQKISQNHNLTTEEASILTEIAESVKNNDWVTSQNKIEQLSDSTLDFFIEYIQNVGYKKNIESFVKEMSIIYLITTLEEFLKNVLKEIFRTRGDILKSSKTITYEEIINLKSYDMILERITEKKAQDIIDQDIQDIGKILLDDFGFPIINDKNWLSFIEVYYRRHVLVHNNGDPDDKYKLKTGIDTPAAFHVLLGRWTKPSCRMVTLFVWLSPYKTRLSLFS